VEEQLIKLIQNKQDEGMKQLTQQYGNMIRYIVNGIVKDASGQEECINDVYLKIWQSTDSFSGERGKLSTWITAIARNTAISYVRKQSTRVLEETYEEILGTGSQLSPEEAFMEKESLEEIMKLINGLRLREKELFLRKYYYLQSTEQIAAELAMTVRAVEGKLYRIRQKLKKWIGGR